MKMLVELNSMEELYAFKEWHEKYLREKQVLEKAKIKIEDFMHFDTRIKRVLKSDGYETIEEIMELNEIDFLKMPNMGRKSVNRIQQALKDYLS